MEGMDSLLYEAALEGNTITLSKLLKQDRLILVRALCTNRLSHKTPLHVAAYLGHVSFVAEILSQQPELAGELDSRQSSPLHIASMKGFVGIVRALLEVNPDMCFARDVDGRNPLHLAAIKGQIDVLEELVRVRPLAASATTLQGETALHLCIKHQQLEALKFLLEKTKEFHRLLNSKDDCGMTILHLAVADKQIEAIRFLTTSTKIEVNALNANGFTAMDILARSKQTNRDGPIYQIYRLLKDAKAVQGIECLQDDRMEKMRNAILVVASLIATVAFQAAVNPPRSPSEDKINAAAPSEANYATSGANFIASFFDFSYESFPIWNTMSFLASVSIIIMFVSGTSRGKVALRFIMFMTGVAISGTTVTYLAALNFLKDYHSGYRSYAIETSSYLVFVWLCVVVLPLSHIICRIIRRIIRLIKYVTVKQFEAKQLRGTLGRPIFV